MGQTYKLKSHFANRIVNPPDKFIVDRMTRDSIHWIDSYDYNFTGTLSRLFVKQHYDLASEPDIYMLLKQSFLNE